jgi:adenosine deaminase
VEKNAVFSHSLIQHLPYGETMLDSHFIQVMPKVELHVHLEGSIRPETLLKLAKRHHIPLPGYTVEELRKWYTFRDFAHFLEIYQTFSHCLRGPQDVELITREFLAGQAAQNILYSEVTYTPYSQFLATGMLFNNQLAAINRARAWAEKELGVRMGLVIDIPRHVTPEEGLVVANWAISGMGNGVVAFGLGGPEIGNPPEKFSAAFGRVRAAGLPAVPHAGETVGPKSIWGALHALHAVRIGHGVRCLEDPALVEELRLRQIPLEVCLSSNVCLKVVPDLASHPLPRLLEEGLLVTLNSDDPPMFNTTLTDEYIQAAQVFHLSLPVLEGLVLNALQSSFLPVDEKEALQNRMIADFASLQERPAPSQ